MLKIMRNCEEKLKIEINRYSMFIDQMYSVVRCQFFLNGYTDSTVSHSEFQKAFWYKITN